MVAFSYSRLIGYLKLKQATYINFDPFQFVSVLRGIILGHVPVELLIVSVPFDGVQIVFTQFVVTLKLGWLPTYSVCRDCYTHYL